jgi:hypothetical protein
MRRMFFRLSPLRVIASAVIAAMIAISSASAQPTQTPQLAYAGLICCLGGAPAMHGSAIITAQIGTFFRGFTLGLSPHGRRTLQRLPLRVATTSLLRMLLALTPSTSQILRIIWTQHGLPTAAGSRL